MSRQLRFAGIAGILSVILGIPEIYFETIKINQPLGMELATLYILTLFLSMILYVVVCSGFVTLAKKTQNVPLHVSSYILMILSIGYFLYMLLSLTIVDIHAVLNVLIAVLMLVFVGAANIPFGIGILQLGPRFGSLATWLGALEIISGISLLSVIFSFIGILLIIPVAILGSILLFRAAGSFDVKHK
ncbi:MAG: hypothetical protein PHZ00_01945 [Candidatus Peribacteraceae bacterium]|nr:hypothetical protein [Candidatus Peribacteraceae bacterium]